MLNACRRQRSVHCKTWVGYYPESLCSTPVGVKDRFTCPGTALQPLLERAQRLSASKIGSRYRNYERPRRQTVLNACRRQRSVHLDWLLLTKRPEKCSTPVGVKDRFTWTDLCPASWRTECSTPVGVKDRFTSTKPAPGPSSESAQRLSASKIGSPEPILLVSRRDDVLNACRRQRSVHVFDPANPRVRCECSTPVGVKDRFTSRSGRSRARCTNAQRLSASKIGSRVRSRA